MADQSPPAPILPARRVTSPSRVACALATGAFCGAVLVSANLVIVNLFGERPADGPGIAFIAFPFAFVFWAIGLLVVGGPVWMLLHALGLTARWMGAVLGGSALVLIFRFNWLDDLMDAHHGMAWPSPLANVLTLCATGAAVGWIVVHRAYKQPTGAQ